MESQLCIFTWLDWVDYLIIQEETQGEVKRKVVFLSSPFFCVFLSTTNIYIIKCFYYHLRNMRLGNIPAISPDHICGPAFIADENQVELRFVTDPPVEAAMPYICTRQCGAVWVTAKRRAARGNSRIRCWWAAHCAPIVVDAVVPDCGHPFHPPRCFLRGTPSSHYGWSQSRHRAYSCHPVNSKLNVIYL